MTVKQIKSIKHTFLLLFFCCCAFTVTAQSKDIKQGSSHPDATDNPIKGKVVKNKKAAQAEAEWRMQIYNSDQHRTNPVSEPSADMLLQKSDEIKVEKPYLPLQLSDNNITLLGRKISLHQSGFPEKIQSYFTSDVKGLSAEPINIITEAIHFHVISAATHKDIKFKNEGITYTDTKPGKISWTALNTGDRLNIEVNASLLFDGFMSYTVKITALQDVKLDDIKLHLPFNMAIAKYMMGLGTAVGARPDTVKWKWNLPAKQDGTWIGMVNAGLQYSLYDQHYADPLHSKPDLQHPLPPPLSWSNSGKGGILITEKGTSMLAENYSGIREMKKGEALYYNFALQVTPLTIDSKSPWLDRFYWNGQ